MTRPRQGRSSRDRDQRGATALEFGLVAPLLFLMIFGIIQYGYLFWSLTTASATAREATRRMVVGADWATCAQAWAIKHASNPAVGQGGVQVTYRYLDDTGHVVSRPPTLQDLVEVTVSFQSLNLNIPFIPVPNDGVVTQSSTAPIENLPSTPVACDGPGNL